MKKNNNPPLDYNEVVSRFNKKGLNLLNTTYKNNHQSLDCEDKEGYRFSIKVNDLNKFSKTKLVYIKNKWSLYNIKKYIKNNDINVQLVSQKYKSSKDNLAFRCQCGQIFYKSWDTFYNKKEYQCSDCVKRNNAKKYTLEYVKQEFLRYGLKILDKEYKTNNSLLLCETIDGYKIKKSFVNRHRDYKANIFSYKNNLENYVYNVNNYFKINNINCKCIKVLDDKCGVHGQHYLKVICCCGNVFKTTMDYIRKDNYRCPKCTNKISNGEAIIAEILDELKIPYERQYKFKRCIYKRELPFDFYIKEYGVCIEYDGIYHYEKQPHVEEEQFNEQLIRDSIKNEFCLENNIKLIRIPYYQRNEIKEIILKELPLRSNES